MLFETLVVVYSELATQNFLLLTLCAETNFATEESKQKE